jgi:hypothetical protein
LSIKQEVAVKGAAERSWELLRLAAYPGLPHTAAAKRLGKWAAANGLEIEFDARTVMAGKPSHDVISVLFTSRS